MGTGCWDWLVCSCKGNPRVCVHCSALGGRAAGFLVRSREERRRMGKKSQEEARQIRSVVGTATGVPVPECWCRKLTRATCLIGPGCPGLRGYGTCDPKANGNRSDLFSRPTLDPLLAVAQRWREREGVHHNSRKSDGLQPRGNSQTAEKRSKLLRVWLEERGKRAKQSRREKRGTCQPRCYRTLGVG